MAEADCHPSRDNGNGRTVRNVIEVGSCHKRREGKEICQTRDLYVNL